MQRSLDSEHIFRIVAILNGYCGQMTEERHELDLPVWALEAFPELQRQIQEYRPDVLILTARKMPRLWEALRMELSCDPLIISDLAIPFISSRLKHSRIAIIDDVVNRGSTLQHIAEMVNTYNPAEVKLFSLAKRICASVQPVSYAHRSPLASNIPSTDPVT